MARLAGLSGVGLLLALSLAVPAGAAGPAPSSGSATVDGDPSEWSAADVFAEMTAGGGEGRIVRAHLSLRYDCDAEVLYGLVLMTEDRKAVQTDPSEAYLRIDGSGKLVSGLSGNDGTPPDFAWIAGDGTVADGFEASGPLAPGAYTVRAHIKEADDSEDGYTAADTVGRDIPLVLDCVASTPTPTVTPAPTPTATPEESQGPTPTPEDSQEPIASVGGETGAPTLTLPPTDAVPVAADRSPTSGAPFIVLGAIAAGAVLLSNRRPRVRTR